MTTLHQIAKRAGVSIGTVDRVIHGRGRVSRISESRVRKAIHALRYRPNIFARQLKRTRPFRFGVMLPRPDQDGRFWRIPTRGITRASEELKSHHIETRFFTFDRYSIRSFARACEAVSVAGLDGLLCAPVLTAAAGKFNSRIPQSLPTVFFDSVIPGFDSLCSIVQDSYASGRLSGRLMHLLYSRPSTLAAIRFLPEDFHIDERVRGFVDYFQNIPAYTIRVVDASADKHKIDFALLVDSLLDQNPNLSGIFVSNALTYGVAMALEKRGQSGRVRVIGYDLLEENVACLRRGSIEFLISQQSEDQGFRGMYTLFRHVVLNEPVPRTITMPIDIITRENVDSARSMTMAESMENSEPTLHRGNVHRRTAVKEEV